MTAFRTRVGEGREFMVSKVTIEPVWYLSEIALPQTVLRQSIFRKTKLR